MRPFLSSRLVSCAITIALLTTFQVIRANEPPRSALPPGETLDTPTLIARVLTTLDGQRQQVEQSLSTEGGQFSRADLLAMYGRSAAASGEFGDSAAAYAMFLSEFGTRHAYSEQILFRLAQSLAPFDLDYVDILHADSGPHYQPTWRMGQATSNDRLRLAVGAYELLAATTKDSQQGAKALLSAGWVHRALQDWNASTAVWDRSSEIAKGTTSGADALWHAADNLAWTGQAAEAAERLRRLTAEHPSDARTKAAAERIESLMAESRRTAIWLDHPVDSLQKEIAERASRRKPSEVYASSIEWLQRQRKSSAIIAVSRWAATQSDWPLQARLTAHLNLVDALLGQSNVDADTKLDAARVLGQVVSLAPNDDWAIPAAIRQSNLLSETRQFDNADHVLQAIGNRWKGNPQWEPRVLIERMQSLVDRGDVRAAKAVRGDLATAYPDYEVPAELTRMLAPAGNGGGR